MQAYMLNSLSMDTGRRIPVVGFFLQPLHKTRSATFLHCSEEEGMDGAILDASLSFLDMPWKPIVGSSNGLLLCSPDFFMENSHYIVCDPVTREFNVIPKPHKVYKNVSLTFICKRNDDRASLDKINYEIFRVGMPNYLITSTYEIETFSSVNGKWKRSHLVSSLPFMLSAANAPGLVLEDVIYWYDMYEFLAVYDRSSKAGKDDEINIQLLKFPKVGESTAWSFRLGLCEGKIYYVRSDKTRLEFWVLYKSSTSVDQWVLKHKVSFTEIYQNNPNKADIGKDGYWLFQIGHVHPRNSNLILLRALDKYYWYDFESGKLDEEIAIDKSCIRSCHHFFYERPSRAPNSASASQWLSRL